MEMSVAAVTLMFWPLLFIGYQDGEFSMREALALGAVWIVLLASVMISGVSHWYFGLPGSALTIFMIARVLGWDAKRRLP